jgi:hypothetical protein
MVATDRTVSAFQKRIRMSNMSRRDLLRYGVVGGATVAAAAALGIQGLAPAGSAAVPPAADPRDFDVVYKGKKIKAKHNARGRDKHDLHINDKKLAVTAIKTLFVPEDGARPYVAVGLITAVLHYAPVEIDEDKNRDGLKKLAMKVIDTLGEFELTDEAAQEHHH